MLKRLLAFSVSMALIVGMVPAIVLADETVQQPEESATEATEEKQMRKSVSSGRLCPCQWTCLSFLCSQTVSLEWFSQKYSNNKWALRDPFSFAKLKGHLNLVLRQPPFFRLFSYRSQIRNLLQYRSNNI